MSIDSRIPPPSTENSVAPIYKISLQMLLALGFALLAAVDGTKKIRGCQPETRFTIPAGQTGKSSKVAVVGMAHYGNKQYSVHAGMVRYCGATAGFDSFGYERQMCATTANPRSARRCARIDQGIRGMKGDFEMDFPHVGVEYKVIFQCGDDPAAQNPAIPRKDETDLEIVDDHFKTP